MVIHFYNTIMSVSAPLHKKVTVDCCCSLREVWGDMRCGLGDNWYSVGAPDGGYPANWLNDRVGGV